jgi:serine/threonine protein kinase
MSVKKTDLGPLEKISSGGFAEVYRANSAFRLRGSTMPLAYKEFTTEEAQQARASAAAVLFRDGLNPADRDDLDKHTAWPRALVEDEGNVTGLLMPLIPPDFFCGLIDPDTGRKTSKPLEMQWLVATKAQLDAAEVELPTVDKAQRLALLAQLAYAIGRLHKHGWVYGDLSFKNAVFALNPPRMMLIDCDGAASVRDPRRQQAHTPFWAPPECEKSAGPRYLDQQDTITDVYKLGLAILRCLSPGTGVSSAKDAARLAGELDPAGLDLVSRALSGDRALRPTAKDLWAYLNAELKRRVRPPELIYAQLATPLRVRGMDARVEWEIRNVSEVTIQVGGSPPEAVASNGRPQVHIIRRPQRSGPVTIEAANQYGAFRIDLGELTLYEIPPFDPKSLTGILPGLPSVPRIDAFALDRLAPALATVPRVALPELPSLPSVPTAELGGVIRNMLPGAGVAGAPELPDLGTLIAGPARELAALLTSQAREFAESRRDLDLTALADTEDDS